MRFSNSVAETRRKPCRSIRGTSELVTLEAIVSGLLPRDGMTKANPAGWEPEEFRPAAERIRASIQARIGDNRVIVFVGTGEAVFPYKTPDQVLTYMDADRKRLTEGEPLVLTAACPETSLWQRVDGIMSEDGFVPFGGRSSLNLQAYVSTTRACFLVAEHPGTPVAVEMTGRAILGWICVGPPT